MDILYILCEYVLASSKWRYPLLFFMQNFTKLLVYENVVDQAFSSFVTDTWYRCHWFPNTGYSPISQIQRCIRQISHSAHVCKQMCTHVHISVTKWCIVGFVQQAYCARIASRWDGSCLFVTRAVCPSNLSFQWQLKHDTTEDSSVVHVTKEIG